MDTYYTLLDIPAQASADEVEVAYQRQRQRYSPERVAALGDEFRTVAHARTAELERAYLVLSDSARRQEYDRHLGDGAAPAGERAPRRSGLTRRELLMAGGGALAGLLMIAVVWILAGRTAQSSLP